VAVPLAAPVAGIVNDVGLTTVTTPARFGVGRRSPVNPETVYVEPLVSPWGIDDV
jgi:hypothetical protein